MSERRRDPGQHTASCGRLLDVIERAGQQGPAPGDDVPVPDHRRDRAVGGPRVRRRERDRGDRRARTRSRSCPNYYEDTTQPILEPPATDLEYQDDYHLEEVTIPIKSLLDGEGIRFIFTSFVPNFAGFGVVAVTFVALMGAGVAEGSGLMGALIRLLVRGLAAAAARVRPDLRRRAVERRHRRRLPDPRAARRRRVRERRPTPAGRHGRLLRRRRRDLRRQPDPGPDRRPDHGDHERGARRGRRHAARRSSPTTGSASSRRSCWRSSRTSSPSGSSSRGWARGSRPASGRRPASSIEDDADAVDDPAAEQRGPALRARRSSLAFIGLVLADHAAARRAAARPRDRRHHRRRRRSWTACCSSSR